MIPRRRFLNILAGSATTLLAPGVHAAYRWTGRALGAEASLTLRGTDRAAAEAAAEACVDEIERLEALFSLYHPGSALNALNRTGVLENPGPDMVRLLAEAQAVARLTGGAFDVTVQPLWRLHAGGTADAWRRSRHLVGYQGLHVTPRRISLARPGMALSLNGIAQGYITDRITELLRRRGFVHALVNLGEHRATGPKDAAGTPWKLAVPGGRVLNVASGAVATSAGAGLQFDPDGGRHRILDPRLGSSPNRFASVTVTAPSTTIADALSTAFYVMDAKQALAVRKRLPGVAVLTEAIRPPAAARP